MDAYRQALGVACRGSANDHVRRLGVSHLIGERTGWSIRKFVSHRPPPRHHRVPGWTTRSLLPLPDDRREALEATNQASRPAH